MFEAPAYPIGNVTKDPELRHTKAGRPVTNIDIATNYPPRADESEPPAMFTHLEFWGKLAVHAVETFRKGDRIMVHGFWVTRERTINGENIVENRVYVLDAGPSIFWEGIPDADEATSANLTQEELEAATSDDDSSEPQKEERPF